MPNQFVTLPVPAGNGIGASVDVSAMGAEKTVVVCGGAFVAAVHIEVSNDGVTWGPFIDFTACDWDNYIVSCRFMRVRVSGYKSGAPVAAVGASGAGASASISLPVPASNGVGTAVDTSALGPLKSIVVAGSYDAVVTIQISEDGVTFSDAESFPKPDRENIEAWARFMRVRQSGYVSGVATVTVTGSSMSAGASGGASGNVFLPAGTGVRRVIYARLTGSDATGTGTLANPYRTFARAYDDVPIFIPDTDTYVVDISGIGIEARTDGWRLKPHQSAHNAGRFNFVPDIPQAYFEAPLVIQAMPQPASGVPVADTLIAVGEMVGQVAEPTSGLMTLTTTKVWPVNAFKGKWLIASGFEGAIAIASNGASTLELCVNFAVTGPLQIVEASAELQNSDPFAGNPGLTIPNVQSGVALTGLRCSHLTPSAFSVSLQFLDQFGSCFAQFLDVRGIDFHGLGSPLIFGMTVNGGGAATLGVQFAGGAPQILNSFFRNGYWDNRNHVGVGDLTLLFGNIFEGMTALLDGSMSGSADFMATGAWWLQWSIVRSGVGNGIEYRGGSPTKVISVLVQGCAGDGVLATGPGYLNLGAAGGTGGVGDPANGGVGCRINNGCQVLRNGATVTGAGGDRKVGANPVAAWGAAESDLVTFSRVF